MTERPYKPVIPYGFILVFIGVAVLYAGTLLDAATITAGGGEAVIGEAYESLFVTFGLWLGLTLLLVIGGLMGDMPRAGALSALFLVPLSGVAALVAIDMCSRHMRLAVALPASLAALIAYYAIWARLPDRRPRLTPNGMTIAVWGGVFGLSMLSFLFASSY